MHFKRETFSNVFLNMKIYSSYNNIVVIVSHQNYICPLVYFSSFLKLSFILSSGWWSNGAALAAAVPAPPGVPWAPRDGFHSNGSGRQPPLPGGHGPLQRQQQAGCGYGEPMRIYNRIRSVRIPAYTLLKCETMSCQWNNGVTLRRCCTVAPGRWVGPTVNTVIRLAFFSCQA